MKNNFESNAKKAVNSWFDENWTNEGYEMMKKTFWYLNDNFRPDNVVNWNVVVVYIKSLDDFNYYDPSLIAKSQGGITLLADYGKLTKPFRCDENWLFNPKMLRCIRINEKHIHWKLNWGSPKFWDSHEYDDYSSVTYPDKILPDYPNPYPIIPPG